MNAQQQAPETFYDKIADVFWWLYWDKDKYNVFIEQGGTWSAKTYSIMQYLGMVAATEKDETITVVGQDLPNLKRGAIRDFETIISSSPMLKRCIAAHNKSNNSYRFKTGTTIEFVSFANAQDAQSGKRKYLFINEANGVGHEIYQELAVRSEVIILDYNATAPFWVHDHVIGKPNAVRHVSNYTNNPYIKPSVLETILAYKDNDPYRWAVFGLGKTGILKDDQWLHAYKESRHVSKVSYNPKEPVFISIDFNVGKFVAIACQLSEVDSEKASWFYVIKEFVMSETAGNIDTMAQHIREAFPTSLLFVTGDQTGSRRDVGYSKSNDTLLTLLQRSLNIGNKQMLFGAYNNRLPTANPTFANSWAHCNNTLSGHPNFKIDPSCKELINDCRIAVFDKKKGGFTLKKGAGDGVYAMNAFDCLRYIINLKCPSYQKIGRVQ